MRPLVMDFRTDPRALNIGDQFMFGPAILVNPVVEEKATTRHLYLPSTKWYDFWTGAALQGAQAIDTSAPLEKLPLFVRAGSIVPMGPDLQFASEKPADPIELRIYPGANGDFVLYEDENDNYNYEKGTYALIPFHWEDGKHTLTIGARSGRFPGMLENRKFRIVVVRDGHGTGIGQTGTADKELEYSGSPVTITL